MYELESLIAPWLDYYMACEAFDRAVCTGPIGRDGILPRTGWEFYEINRNAQKQMRRMQDRYPWVTKAQWHSAKMYVLDHYDLEREYAERLTVRFV